MDYQTRLAGTLQSAVPLTPYWWYSACGMPFGKWIIRKGSCQ
jgi:hypothetical protein